MTAPQFQLIQGQSVQEQPVISDENRKFLADIQATFRHEKHGVAGPWQYSSSLYEGDPVKGALLWENFLSQSVDYYPLPNEIDLIRDHAGSLISDKVSPVTLVDIGPGPAQAVLNKTIPVKEQFKDVYLYCPIDTCPEYLVSAGQVLHDNQAHLSVKAYHVDYTKDKIALPKVTRAFGVFFGGTVGNVEGHPDMGLPEEIMIEQLHYIREILGHNGTLMITHDANQDEVSILQSYMHPLQIAFGANIMYRIARDLPVYGYFDPKAWHYEPRWYAKNHQLAHTIICDRDQTFWLGEERFHITAGEQFILNNSFKYPVEKMKEWASAAGFKSQRHVMDHQGRQALHVLQS